MRDSQLHRQEERWVRGTLTIDIAFGQADIARAQHRAEHPPVVQAQAGMRGVALARALALAHLQRAAVGQLQVQGTVLQALQQAQAVARIGRQASRQMELKRSAGRVHGQ